MERRLFDMKSRFQELLTSLLEKGVQDGCFPGGVAACGMGNEVWATACAGSLYPDGPQVNLHTRYDMASCSKVLSPTMVALRFLEQGRLGLYDTIGTFVPDAPADKKEITILQLMTHTAGFNPSFRLDHITDDPANTLKVCLDYPLDNAPGGAPSYSCMGYITLTKILEIIGGKNISDLAQEMVFGPLGMKNTGYCPSGDNIAATERQPDGSLLTGIVHDENARFQNGISGNAGVFSDLADVVRFAQMLANGGEGYLSPVTLQKAIRCYTPGADVHRGLGFHLAGTEFNFMGDLVPDCSFGHTGFTGTSLVVDPTTGFYMVLLTNRVCPTRDNLTQARFRRLFHNAVYAEAMRR